MLPLVAILLIPTLVFAVTFEAGEELISPKKIINDDYYGAGGTVQMDSNINGDLTIAGGKLFVDSIVSSDLTLAGGDIILQGEVKDDARLFAGNITINAPVKDDLIMGGGNITMSSKSSVGGDLVFGGGNVILNGQVNGSIIGGGGNVHINGLVKGNVKLYSVDKLTFGPNAKVNGNLTYKSPKASKNVSSKTVIGTIKYEPRKGASKDYKAKNVAMGMLAGFSFFQLLSLLFVGLFFVWLLRFYMQRSVEESYKRPLQSFGIGFAIMILTPIAALISLLTGVGILFSLILMLVWIMALIFGKLMAAAMIGMKIVKIKDRSSFLRVYGAFALGVLIYVLLTFIPVVGWIIKFVLTCIGIGAMATYETSLFNSLRKSKKI